MYYILIIWKDGDRFWTMHHSEKEHKTALKNWEKDNFVRELIVLNS